MRRALLALAMVACTVERPKTAAGLGSFSVEVSGLTPFTGVGCTTDDPMGTRDCPRPFVESTAPVALHLTITALDQRGEPLSDYAGLALIDARPGRVMNASVAGLAVRFAGGVGQVDVQLAQAHGATRLWVEECGSGAEVGSFATGVSREIFFDNPRIDQIQSSVDNTTSPMIPRFSNVCSIAGDPRFGIGSNEDGEAEFMGYSRGRTVNAPPPAMGDYVEVVGCSGAEFDAATLAGGSCARGPLIVTGVGNEGFYLTDVNPAAVAKGFNSLYVFNFNYPDDLEVGDLVLSLRGSPVEFAGSTQIGNPAWRKDLLGKRPELLPKPKRIDPVVYKAALGVVKGTRSSYGRNNKDGLDLERLEGSLVCMDNLAPASRLQVCDLNRSGGIERRQCVFPSSTPLPPSCAVGREPWPQPDACDERSVADYCIPAVPQDGQAPEDAVLDFVRACDMLTDATFYMAQNPAEFCCERLCYVDRTCTDGSSYASFGQWVASTDGEYEATAAPPEKVAFNTRDANPDFDPIEFGARQLPRAKAERKHLRIIGNLRQILAARPVWVIVARTPADIAVDEACPP